jgi:outer membrane lipoprotein-sorting protein
VKAAAVLVLALATSAHAQASPTPAEVLANVERYYASVNMLTASFRQTVKNATFGTTKMSDGWIALQAPGHYRFDYLVSVVGFAVPVRAFVGDGTTLIAIDHRNRTYADIPSSRVRDDLQFFYRASSLTQTYTVTRDQSGTYGEPSDVVLKLSSSAMTLFLVVNATDWHVTESIIVDPNGNVNELQFFGQTPTRAVSPSQFLVTPPPGYTRVP